MIRCHVPFCPSTTRRGSEGSIWFCSEHWGAISPNWRRMARLFAKRDGYWSEGLVRRLLDEAIFGSAWMPRKARR